MQTTASKLGLLAGAILLLLSVFFAALPMLYDDMPVDPAIQAAQDIETAIYAHGGFIVAGLGFAGSLLLGRRKKLSRLFLICSAALCFMFAIYFGLIVQSVLFICFVSIPGVLLIAASTLSFRANNFPNDNNRYI